MPSGTGRPIIGITTSRRAMEADGGLVADYAHAAYADAIAAGGGVPMLLPTPADDWPMAAEAVALRALEVLDGLLLTGGGDMDPAFYGQQPAASNPPDRQRDQFEIALTTTAIAREVALLGICRGAQVLCVATGGELVQHIPDRVEGEVGHSQPQARYSPVHEVRLAADSALAGIYGTESLSVNSTHHQAPGRLAGGLVATGHASDGVIEALELPSASWVIGVQWHPEELWKSYAEHRVLFDAFAEAARTAAKRA